MLRQMIALRLGSARAGVSESPKSLENLAKSLPAGEQKSTGAVASQIAAFNNAIARRERRSPRMQAALYSPRPAHFGAPLDISLEALAQVIAVHRCARAWAHRAVSWRRRAVPTGMSGGYSPCWCAERGGRR